MRCQETDDGIGYALQAIAIAREIGLDQVRIVPDMSDDEKAWTRIKQRVWLSLFVANTM